MRLGVEVRNKKLYMKLSRFFPTTIGIFNDIKFTNEVLPIAREILYGVGKEDHIWKYKTTFSREEQGKKLNNILFIKEYLKDLSNKFIDSMGFEWINHVELDLFVTKMEKGDRHDLHIHPYSILSGVCYLNTSEDCSPIVFEDPRNVRFFNSLKPKNITTIDNRYDRTYLPKNGDILIWESWLKHKVETNECDCRETLVFNVFNN